METQDSAPSEAAYERLTPYCGCGSMLMPPGSHRQPTDRPVEVRCSCGAGVWALFWQRQPVSVAMERSAESLGEMAPRHRVETGD